MASIQKMDPERSIYGAIATNFIRPTWAALLLLFTVVAMASLQISTKAVFPRWPVFSCSAGWFSSSSSENDVVLVLDDPRSCSGFFQGVSMRKVVMSIGDFGGVGDGKTSNTETFRRAVRYLKRFGDKGGSQLNVPKGRWLTGSFNLTSNFTLFLEEGAVILGSQVSPTCKNCFFWLQKQNFYLFISFYVINY